MSQGYSGTNPCDKASQRAAMRIEVVFVVLKHELEFLELEPKMILRKHISIASLRVQVTYSLDGAGEGIQREVEWYGTHGKDYKSHS